MASKAAPPVNPRPVPNQPASTKSTTPAKRYGFFENAAVWLLARLPWFNTRYQNWTKTRRIVVGLLMYIIILPVIPTVVGIVMYVRNPEGFKKGNASKILGAIIAAQLALFGLVAVQPAMPDNPVKDAVNEATGTNIQGEPTGGRVFDNCDEAFKAGVKNIPKTDLSYRAALDGDNDGVACEK
ncbi:excalibur calcium-binding domain-containing protein [bacterium]|nr:MAG: excalibur calcium-binding domain-containing protein [bacterium]